MKCVNCGRSLGAASAYCPACGHEVAARPGGAGYKPSKRLAVGFVALSLIVSCIVANSSDTQKQADVGSAAATIAKARIDSLDARARSIPSGNTKENLKAYEELLALVPESTRYQERVAHYRSRLENLKTAPPAAVEAVPPYRIFSDERLGTVKRSVEVRIEDRITVAQLEKIARQIRQKRDQKTFILYYLPGMESGHGAWASTHFNPELQVIILGETVEEADVMSSSDIPDGAREVVGSWAISGLAARRIDIYATDEGWWIRILYKEGTGNPVRATRTTTGGLVSYAAEGATDGEHYRIRSDGNLEIWDREGLIESARPLAR